MQIQPDFTEALDSVPPGKYPARIVEIKFDDTTGGPFISKSEKQTPYIKVVYEIFNSETAAKVNGRKIWDNLMLQGPGAGRLKAVVAAAGLDTTAGGFDTDDLLGKEVLITCVEKKDQNGNPSSFPEVKGVAKYTG